MSNKVMLKTGVVQKVNSAVADVLLTSSAPFNLYMGGNKAPVADSVWSVVKPPVIIPKGVGAYITGSSFTPVEVQGQVYDQSNVAPTDPFPAA